MIGEFYLIMEHWKNNIDRRKLNVTENLKHTCICTYISVHGFANTCKHTQSTLARTHTRCLRGPWRKVGRCSRQVGLTNVQEFADDFTVENRDSQTVVLFLLT
jgi:hypothetical protein